MLEKEEGTDEGNPLAAEFEEIGREGEQETGQKREQQKSSPQ